MDQEMTQKEYESYGFSSTTADASGSAAILSGVFFLDAEEIKYFVDSDDQEYYPVPIPEEGTLASKVYILDYDGNKYYLDTPALFWAEQYEQEQQTLPQEQQQQQQQQGEPISAQEAEENSEASEEADLGASHAQEAEAMQEMERSRRSKHSNSQSKDDDGTAEKSKPTHPKRKKTERSKSKERTTSNTSPSRISKIQDQTNIIISGSSIRSEKSKKMVQRSGSGSSIRADKITRRAERTDSGSSVRSDKSTSSHIATKIKNKKVATRSQSGSSTRESTHKSKGMIRRTRGIQRTQSGNAILTASQYGKPPELDDLEFEKALRVEEGNRQQRSSSSDAHIKNGAENSTRHDCNDESSPQREHRSVRRTRSGKTSTSPGRRPAVTEEERVRRGARSHVPRSPPRRRKEGQDRELESSSRRSTPERTLSRENSMRGGRRAGLVKSRSQRVSSRGVAREQYGHAIVAHKQRQEEQQKEAELEAAMTIAAEAEAILEAETAKKATEKRISPMGFLGGVQDLTHGLTHGTRVAAQQSVFGLAAAVKTGVATVGNVGHAAAGATFLVGKTVGNAGYATTQAAAGGTMKVGKTVGNIGLASTQAAAGATMGIGKFAVGATAAGAGMLTTATKSASSSVRFGAGALTKSVSSSTRNLAKNTTSSVRISLRNSARSSTGNELILADSSNQSQVKVDDAAPNVSARLAVAMTR